VGTQRTIESLERTLANPNVPLSVRAARTRFLDNANCFVETLVPSSVRYTVDAPDPGNLFQAVLEITDGSGTRLDQQTLTLQPMGTGRSRSEPFVLVPAGGTIRCGRLYAGIIFACARASATAITTAPGFRDAIAQIF
jgi:hypothetical protein